MSKYAKERVKVNADKNEEDVRLVRGMGRGFSDHHIVLGKVRLVGAWIKKKEVVVGARRTRSEKLR